MFVHAFAVIAQDGSELGQVQAELLCDASREATRLWPDHADTRRLVRLTPLLKERETAA